MFFCSSGGSEPLSVSKTDILRAIISEKLTTAAREIFAVVERTVTDYEAEASGFRRQLELLQPRVKPKPRDQRSHEVVVVGEEEEQPDEEEAESQDLLPWTNEEGEDDEDEEDQPAAKLGSFHEDMKDPDYIIPSRSDSSTVHSVRKRAGRPRISDTLNHVDLRVCLLEDSQTQVLSKTVFKKTPVQDLKCPRGLQESDFLDLLRSSFPQLANGEPFDLFMTDQSRKLLPLRVKALTPEEIYSSIRSTGKSSLYIRLKNGGREREESPGFPRITNRPSADAELLPSAGAELHTRSDSSGVHSVRRRPGRPRISGTPNHVDLRVCLLEDSQTQVLSKTVFKKTPVQDLKCPRGLQESDFLDLLRSSFPQLADGEPFDLFMTDQSRKLLPLRVKALTPEEIYSSIRSTGKSSLYIRLKNVKENKDLESESISDQPAPESRLLRSPISNVDAPKEEDLSNNSAEEELDLETEAESDLDSTNDDDWNPDPGLHTRQKPGRKRAKGGAEERKLSCKVCGVWYRLLGYLIKHTWSHVDEQQGVCGVCGEKSESVEELKEHLRNHQKLHSCSHCGKTFVSASSLHQHVSKHTGDGTFKCNICNKTLSSKFVLSNHRWVHVKNKPHKCEVCLKSFGLKAQLSVHRKIHMGGKKHHCDICGKAFNDRRSMTQHRLIHLGDRHYSCKVCGKRFKLQNTLKSHEKTHSVQTQSFLCHVCCKTFLSEQRLVVHLKTHSNEKPYVCEVCAKSFAFKDGLKRHMKVHTGEAPYECFECGRCFKFKSKLNAHVFLHSGIKKFVCGVCGKAFSRREYLKVHMRTHNGERPYKCPRCEKAFTQSHCLKTHMKSHQAEENSDTSPSES